MPEPQTDSATAFGETWGPLVDRYDLRTAACTRLFDVAESAEDEVALVLVLEIVAGVINGVTIQIANVAERINHFDAADGTNRPVLGGVLGALTKTCRALLALDYAIRTSLEEVKAKHDPSASAPNPGE